MPVSCVAQKLHLPSKVTGLGLQILQSATCSPEKAHVLKTPLASAMIRARHIDQPSFLQPAIFTKPSENCWSKNFLRAYGHLAGREGTPKRYLIGVRAWPIDQFMISLLKMIQDWMNSQDHLFIEMTNPTELHFREKKKNMTR